MKFWDIEQQGNKCLPSVTLEGSSVVSNAAITYFSNMKNIRMTYGVQSECDAAQFYTTATIIGNTF